MRTTICANEKFFLKLNTYGNHTVQNLDKENNNENNEEMQKQKQETNTR